MSASAESEGFRVRKFHLAKGGPQLQLLGVPLLSLLRIKNLALVEDLEWELGPGFTAITGETGAGKSIIIGALKLLLGERAEKSLIRTGAEACTVEAIFDGGDFAELNARLEEAGAEPGDGALLLKRSFSLGGSTRQFVNGSPATLALLKTIGDELVDLHGPHDHQSLLAPERQLALLDGFAHAEPALAEYRKVFRELQALVAEEAGAEHGGIGARAGARFAPAPGAGNQRGATRA